MGVSTIVVAIDREFDAATGLLGQRGALSLHWHNKTRTNKGGTCSADQLVSTDLINGGDFAAGRDMCPAACSTI